MQQSLEVRAPCCFGGKRLLPPFVSWLFEQILLTFRGLLQLCSVSIAIPCRLMQCTTTNAGVAADTTHGWATLHSMRYSAVGESLSLKPSKGAKANET